MKLYSCTCLECKGPRNRKYVWSLKKTDDDIIDFIGTAKEANMVCVKERRNVIGYRYLTKEELQ